MQSYKSLLMIAMGVLCGSILAGCSEDAESRASREAVAACERAISIMQSTGDVEKARAALSQVQVSKLKGRDLAGIVAMVQGSIFVEEANKKASGAATDGAYQAGLATVAKRQADAMQALAGKLYDYQRLEAEKLRMQKVIEGAQGSLAELKAALAGSDGDGLEAQLAMAQAELANLEQEKSQWQQQADSAADIANKLQSQAQEFFSKSDLAKGAERDQLRQKGYDILLGRNGGQSKEAILVKAQAAMDQVSFIESRMNVARSRVEKLTADVAGIKQQLPSLESTASGSALRAGVSDIGAQQARLTSEIGSQLGEVEKAAGEFAALADEVTGLYGQACEEYSRAAGSRGGTPGAARFALADCQYRSGLVMANLAALHENLAARAESMTMTAPDGFTQKKLKELSSQHSAKRKQLLDAALAIQGEACESYKAVTGVSKGATCSAVASNVFAYLERLKLAAQVTDSGVMASMKEELQALDERGLDCGEEFAATTAAKMLAATMKDAGVPRGAPRPEASAEESAPEPSQPAEVAPVEEKTVESAEPNAGPAIDPNSN